MRVDDSNKIMFAFECAGGMMMRKHVLHDIRLTPIFHTYASLHNECIFRGNDRVSFIIVASKGSNKRK